MRSRDEWGLARRLGGQIRADPPQAMGAVNPTHRPLAGAYLALGDDPEPPLTQRSVPRVLTAVVAAVTLALAVPIGWAATTSGRLPADQPAATPAAKAAAPALLDNDDAAA
jgi:hypothetical protein